MVEQRNIYKGHRYVPKIVGDWNESETYEGLSIVTHEGNSYTSKKRVPVGVDLFNKEYWVSTGNYNAQLDYYRDEVDQFTENFKQQLDELVVSVANYTGATDSEKIQKAMNEASGKTLKLEDNKTYLIDQSIVGVSDVKVIGHNTTLKVKDNSRVLNIFNFSNKKNIHIKGINFDMNMQGMPIYLASEYNTNYNVALELTASTGVIIIEESTFVNLYNIAINVYNINGLLSIKNNIFTSPVQNQNQKATHIWLLSISDLSSVSIINNQFLNDSYTDVSKGVNSIFIASVKGKTMIDNNLMNNVGRDNTGSHRLLPIDLYGDCENISITNNKIKNSKYGFIRIHNCKNIVVDNNHIEYSGVLLPEPLIIIVNDTVYTTEQNCDNIKITNNEIYAYQNSRILEGIRIYTYDWSQRIENLLIENNSFYGNITTAIKMFYGYKNVTIKNNKAFTFNNSLPAILLSLTRMTWEPISTTMNEVDVISSELLISHNQWHTENNGIIIEKGTHTGVVSTIHIEGNDLDGATGFNGIRVIGLDVFITNNILSNYSSGIRIDGDGLATILNNVLKDTLNKIYKADATRVVIANNYQDGELIV